MALLDVSEVLSDPDFMDTGLICYRNAQTIGTNGMAVNTERKFTFNAVVTSDSGHELNRTAEGDYQSGAIMVHTATQLQDGSVGLIADEIEWQGRRYTVERINSYSHFGRGFVAATCALKPLAG